jgi:hypothetical protein
VLRFGDAPLQDDSPVTAAHVVRDLGGVFAVVHQQQVNFPDVVDQELLQTTGKKVSRLRFGVSFAVASKR